MKIPRKFRRNFGGKFRGLSPSVYSEELSDELVVLGVSSEIWFLGIPSENSEGFSRKIEFPKSYFRGLVSSVCRRNNVIPTTYRRFFPSVCRCFLVVRRRLQLRSQAIDHDDLIPQQDLTEIAIEEHSPTTECLQQETHKETLTTTFSFYYSNNKLFSNPLNHPVFSI
ncbi:hypothetical protein DY000_02022101 [Brassica cretica]|uniref:Uncharacterized protein n=1 Tax=Brassica cretica TaxID=69181 RepID=A0ABQ7EFB2_BRACR|nr:hypothetical protein DY000_02022101 [Brassica cretica]